MMAQPERAQPRKPNHMGVIADQLTALLEQMKESDRRMQRLTEEFIKDTNELLEKYRDIAPDDE